MSKNWFSVKEIYNSIKELLSKDYLKKLEQEKCDTDDARLKGKSQHRVKQLRKQKFIEMLRESQSTITLKEVNIHANN